VTIPVVGAVTSSHVAFAGEAQSSKLTRSVSRLATNM
jgi:hypothetical protein